MRAFADTGAFIALVDPEDKHHGPAKEFLRAFIEGGGKLVTTNYVVCETLNFLRARISYENAVHFREAVLKNPAVEILVMTLPLDEAAFAIFKNYSDKNFSFTDCTSFAVMEAMRIKKAFAFDRHFEQYGGFTRLPGKM